MRPLYTASDLAREVPGGDEPPYRSPFRRDYARLLHCPAFRRLQGKTQLFPSSEHDFFRNRLTHSLEVAQIAKSIALRLNHCHSYFADNPIDLDLVETAALAHDLGHPPFGHNGERALDDCMKESGGFEGNAQSLRILARLEKKEPQPSDVGLNLTHRTLAATLKYDHLIPVCRKEDEALVKGFYHSEQELVANIKQSVLGKYVETGRPFKTIECQIMDLADDIAYSTYDLEDALKAGFVTATKMILEVLNRDVIERMKTKMSVDLSTIFRHLMDIWLEPAFDPKSLRIDTKELDLQRGEHVALLATAVAERTRQLNDNGAARTRLTSHLVNECIEATDISEFDTEFPALSELHLNEHLKTRIGIIKHLTYAMVTQSPSLKTVEYRGYDIVQTIFDALSEDGGDMLLPDDYRTRANTTDQLARHRAICDFIAGMTDRYAMEFHGRLRSGGVQTIFKPL